MGDVSNMAPASNKTVEVSGTIMVAAIVVLFMVIVFILFLHLYAKWFWSRQVQDGMRRSSRRRGLQFNPAQDPAFVMHRGLEPSVISSIPVVVFSTEKFVEGLECAVCLSELEDGEKARLLPKCNHGFHVECIDMWFQSHSTCPLCRDTVGGIESEKSSPTQDGSEVLEDVSFVYSGESLNFPTNVLFWGDQSQINTGAASLEEAPSSNSSRNGALMIEIPRQTTEENSSVPLSSFTPEEEMKSPTMAPLRSLRRLLSRENRVITPSSPSSVDVELGEVGRGQSSKTTTD